MSPDEVLEQIQLWLTSMCCGPDGKPMPPQTDDELRMFAGHVAAHMDEMFPDASRKCRREMRRDLLRAAGDKADAWKSCGSTAVVMPQVQGKA